MIKKLLLALALCFVASGAWAQNYSATAGSGLTFGSKLVSAVQYPQIVFCDPTTPAQCVAVNASGQLTLSNTTFGATQGNAGSNAQAWWTQIGDTARGPAKVQAGNAAAAADVALTVADPNVLSALSTATPAGTNRIGYTSDDPCSQKTKTNFAFSTTSGNVQLVAPSGSTQVYICSLVTVGAAASVQSLIAGTGAACTTANEEAVIGSTTAANGMSFSANGGFSFGSGSGTVARSTTAGNGICLLQSGTTAIAGGGSYVQQ